MNIDKALLQFKGFLTAEKGYSPKTVAAYLSDISLLCNDIALTKIDGLTQQSVSKGFIALKKREYKKTTMNRKISALKTFVNYLLREKLLASNPLTYVETPKYSTKLPKLISEDEIKALLTQPDSSTKTGLRDELLLNLLYACGLRVTELVTLKRANIYIEKQFLRVLGKGSKERIIPFNVRCKVLLQRYITLWKEDLDDVYLFSRRKGQALSRQTAWLIIKQYIRFLPLNPTISPHTLRHSFATHLLNHDVDLRYVQAMLGHADISTTQIYTAVTNTHLRRAYNKAHPRS